MVPWSSGQDVALSRQNQGFDSPWDYQKKQKRMHIDIRFFTPCNSFSIANATPGLCN